MAEIVADGGLLALVEFGERQLKPFLRFRIEPREAVEDRFLVGVVARIGRADPFVDEVVRPDGRGRGAMTIGGKYHVAERDGARALRDRESERPGFPGFPALHQIGVSAVSGGRAGHGRGGGERGAVQRSRSRGGSHHPLDHVAPVHAAVREGRIGRVHVRDFPSSFRPASNRSRARRAP